MHDSAIINIQHQRGSKLFRFPKNFVYENFPISIQKLPIPYLRLSVDVPVDTIYQEWLGVQHLMVPHRDANYENHQGWYSLCIHGLAADKTQHFSCYGYEKDAPPKHSWTSIADQCPMTVEWIKQTFPSKSYQRIRFMLLKAGGKIDWHKDNDRFILGPINISITHPKSCEMHWRDLGTQPWQPGEAYLMNVSFEHMVENASQEDRLHIIIDPISLGIEFDDLLTRTVYDHM